jgi:hypothetical protein
MADDKLIIDVDIKPLRMQLREATQELQKAQQAFGPFSKEAELASRKVAAIRDAMEDAAESAKLFDPGSRFQAITTFASQAAAGVSAFQGAMALVGTESKEVEKTLLKVQGAMALSQGLSELKDISKSFNQLKISATSAIRSFASASVIGATKAANGIFKALGVSVSTSARSFKVLRSAIISTGIGALVVGIGMAIDALTDWISETKAQEEATKGLKTADEQLADQIEETNARIEDRISQLEFSRNKEVILAKARGASLDEIRKIEDNHYKESLGLLQNSYSDKEKTYLSFLQAELTRQGRGQEEINLVMNNWYNKNLVDLNTYYNLMGENGRKMYDQLKADLDKGEKDKFNLNREYSLLEANRKLEDHNTTIANQKKYGEKSAKNAEELEQKRKEAEEIIYNARKAMKDKFEQELMDIEKEYEENKKKIAAAKFKDKKKEEEALALLKSQYEKEKTRIETEAENERKERDRAAREKAREFMQEINDMRFEIIKTGIKDEWELQKAELDKGYEQQRAEILANEELTFYQKFLLISTLTEKYNAQLKQQKEQKKIQETEEKAMELEELANEQTNLISVRQAALDREAQLYQELYDKKMITEKQYTEFKKNISKTQAQIDADRLDQQLQFADAVGQMFGTISSMMGEGTAEYKAFAVAEAIISTYTSIAKTLAAFSGKPIPGYAIAQAVATGLFGFAQVKKILETKVPDGKDAGGNGGNLSAGGGGGGAAPPVPTLQTVTNTPINAVFDSLNSRQQPVRAFVVESEITANQNRVSDIERRSRF